MGRKSTRQEIALSDAERARLDGIVSNPKSLQKPVWRARIVLELGAGCGLAETLRRTGLSKPTVWRWWDRVKAGVALAMSSASTSTRPTLPSSSRWTRKRRSRHADGRRRPGP